MGRIVVIGGLNMDLHLFGLMLPDRDSVDTHLQAMGGAPVCLFAQRVI